jgi:hypothetical protein
MPPFSSKHGKREQSFFIQNFPDGLNQEVAPPFLPLTALSRCKNMKFAFNESLDGKKTVVLKKRQGTEKISATALGSAVLACTYYVADAHYIVATASAVSELDSSTFVPATLGSISGVPTFTEFHGKLIIHDSGVTKAWNGTTFETLTCLYTDELIETGDGTTVKFAGTLAHPAARPAATPYFFTIDFTDTTAKVIVDDGNGRLTGNVSSAVVKNITGASKAATCSITCVGHGYSNGDIVNIQSVGGMTQINNLSFVVTSTGNDSFTIPVNSTGYTDYTSGGTASANAIAYTTGAYTFTADGSPDNTTPVYATYEKVSGAPKSKAGFVRAGRLYAWGDSDNPSRLWYTGPNDEDAWDVSSGGGYIDVDPLDGYSLTSCLNFFQSIVTIKGNSIGRIDNFPGDNTFRVEPLVKDLGSPAYLSCTNEGNVISLLSAKRGWIAVQPATEYGGVSQEVDLSKNFRTMAIRFTAVGCYTEFNKIDNQLWLTLYNDTTQLPVIYVVNLETGGQLSVYEFAFAHTCYTFVNSEMLIGGSDGHLYRLFGDNSKFTDNVVSYSDDTYVTGGMTNFGVPINRKHNKKIYLHIYGKSGMTATFNVYTDGNYDVPYYTKAISLNGGAQWINPDGMDLYIYDMSGMWIGTEPISERDDKIDKKFNYRELMFELTDIDGPQGAEFYGVDFFGAIVGD